MIISFMLILSDLKEKRITKIERELENLKTPNKLTLIILSSIRSTYSGINPTPPNVTCPLLLSYFHFNTKVEYN